MAVIQDLVTAEEGVRLEVDGRALELSWRWLRDHARDETSYLAAAQQRIVTPAVVAEVSRAEAITDGATLSITFPGGAAATFAAEFLATLDTAARMYPMAAQPRMPWDAATIADRFLTLDHDAFRREGGLDTVLSGLARDGIVALRGVPCTTEATRAVLEHFGYVRTTIFGDIWEFSADASTGGGFDDTASTPREITPHTDGTYSLDAPGLLGLHCHAYDATGGENVFTDGIAVAERLAADSPEQLELLRRIEIPGQYIGDGAHLIARRPVLRYEDDELVQVSYNHHDRAPFLLPEPTMSALYDALHHFDALANTRELQFELAIQAGDMVIFDNWRVLHGRRAFRGHRHIVGGYINREDVDSTRRRQALGPMGS